MKANRFLSKVLLGWTYTTREEYITG